MKEMRARNALRYSEDQPRDDHGRWTDGGGSDDEGSSETSSGGSSTTTSTPAAAPALKPTKVAHDPVSTTIERPNPPAASSPAPAPAEAEQTPKGKVKVEDFAKEKIKVVIPSTGNKAEREKNFIDAWEQNVGEAPADFKHEFFGGLDSDVTITASPNGKEWEISGKIVDHGANIGTFTRRIDWDRKTAESAYFALNRNVRGADIGKKMLAGNVEFYKKVGLKSVSVHANIDVGGYAWAKYGYVPTRNSWIGGLAPEIKGRLGRGESSGGGDTYTADEWEVLSSDQQDRAREAWMSNTFDEFYQSEIDNWRENGDALDDAKSELAYNNKFLDSSEAIDAINELRDARHSDDQPDFPYTTNQILEALSIEEYERGYGGRKDPEFTFDDDKLKEPSNAPPKEQMALPGIEPADLSQHLTEDMRDEITSALVTAFNDKAEKDAEDIEPPDYLRDSVSEYQEMHWDDMSDEDKLRAAINSGNAEIEVEADESEPVEVPVDSDRQKLLDAVNSNDPKSIWKIADSPQGKQLLLNTDWNGVLDFNDKESMDRFHSYVGKGKRDAA